MSIQSTPGRTGEPRGGSAVRLSHSHVADSLSGGGLPSPLQAPVRSTSVGSLRRRPVRCRRIFGLESSRVVGGRRVLLTRCWPKCWLAKSLRLVAPEPAVVEEGEHPAPLFGPALRRAVGAASFRLRTPAHRLRSVRGRRTAGRWTNSPVGSGRRARRCTNAPPPRSGRRRCAISRIGVCRWRRRAWCTA